MADLKTQVMPLFPLQRVLFPTVSLPLQIFEQRYLNLVKAASSSDQAFAVVPILAGREVGATPEIHHWGTAVRICDWSQLPNGLLGIVVRGEQRVRIERSWTQDDGLATADVVLQSADRECPVAKCDADLADLLMSLAARTGLSQWYIDEGLTDVSLAWRLADLLPVERAAKLDLLAENDPALRLSRVRGWVVALSQR